MVFIDLTSSAEPIRLLSAFDAITGLTSKCVLVRSWRIRNKRFTPARPDRLILYTVWTVKRAWCKDRYGCYHSRWTIDKKLSDRNIWTTVDKVYVNVMLSTGHPWQPHCGELSIDRWVCKDSREMIWKHLRSSPWINTFYSSEFDSESLCVHQPVLNFKWHSIECSRPDGDMIYLQ